MDKFSFRAKRIDNGEWVKGALVINEFMDRKEAYIIEAFNVCECNIDPDVVFYEVDPATLGQSTGLRDKNGKLIFKGVIIRCDYNIHDIYEGVIQWSKLHLQWIVARLNGTSHIDLFEFTNKENTALFSAEIIDNIHDDEAAQMAGM